MNKTTLVMFLLKKIIMSSLICVGFNNSNKHLSKVLKDKKIATCF